jgi:hypothetical protein
VLIPRRVGGSVHPACPGLTWEQLACLWQSERTDTAKSPGTSFPLGRPRQTGSGTSTAIIPLKPKDGLNGAPSIFCRCGKYPALRAGLTFSGRPSRALAIGGICCVFKFSRRLWMTRGSSALTSAAVTDSSRFSFASASKQKFDGGRIVELLKRRLKRFREDIFSLLNR